MGSTVVLIPYSTVHRNYAHYSSATVRKTKTDKNRIKDDDTVLPIEILTVPVVRSVVQSTVGQGSVVATVHVT